MERFSYEIGRLSGILEGFSYINNKVNHGFTFELFELDNKKTIEDSSDKYYKKLCSDAYASFGRMQFWKTTLSSTLKEWLFSYQPRFNQWGKIISHGPDHLRDHYDSFDLSDEDSRNDMVLEFCDALDNTLDIIRGVHVFMNAENTRMYDIVWEDLAFEGRYGSVFMHLGWSD